MKFWKKFVSWTLIATLVLATVGCGKEVAPEELQELPGSIQNTEAQGATLELLSALVRQKVEGQTPDHAFSAGINDFAVSLLQHSRVSGENTVLSPYSVYMALAMSANGAQGQTLAQMEALLGKEVSELNPYILGLQEGSGAELQQANSVWFHSDLAIKEEFLQSLKNYFEAQAFQTAFSDKTLEEMNRWINDATAGRIPEALDQMNPNAMLYLINALTFDALWKAPYNTNQLMEGAFYGSQGEKSVQMMCSTEHTYLEDAKATGFMKDYAGDQYSFLALLPKEGVTLEEYLSSLTGESLMATVEAAQTGNVVATMPKVSLETSVEMEKILAEMGMVDAFTMDADFTGIEGNGDLFISRVLHKTYLQVDELGTQAGAVTIEEFATKGFMLEVKTVTLDRPYVMGIYDKVNGCFLFLGTVENPV
ncbi:MAG: serpin family protein [Oscillospiraceae bacterium]|nr:serpin family protein [Oscillospiraceae bacterium]